jgi:orotidine-5'-phosphate decarboxylase
VLDGYKSVLSAYAHGNSIGGPILGGVEAGIAGAFAIAQIRKIEQSTFTPSTPSVGAGGTGGQQQQERIQAPTFNVIGEANQTQQVNDKPVKAYVVSGEVTTQQSLDRNRLRNATL